MVREMEKELLATPENNGNINFNLLTMRNSVNYIYTLHNNRARNVDESFVKEIVLSSLTVDGFALALARP